MPALGETLASQVDLGLFFTLHGLLYGVSKFAMAFWATAQCARFMAVGLGRFGPVERLLRVQFRRSDPGHSLDVNGWFQGMGFPPCARLMTHWFPPKQLATRMSVLEHLPFHRRQCGGGACAAIWSPIPGAVFLGSRRAGDALPRFFLWFTLRDTPTSTRPAGGGRHGKTAQWHGRNRPIAEDGSPLSEPCVQQSPHLAVALANFFVYTMRYAVLDWGPTFLSEARHIELSQAGWMVAAFEISGLPACC